MKITIQSRSGRNITSIDSLNPNSTVKDVKDEIFLSKSKLYPERQRLTLQSSNPATVLVDDKKLSDYKLTSDCVIILKDLGPQIQWKTVFILEYLGPILVYPIFYLQPSFIYGEVTKPLHFVQQLALVFFLIHYFKREYETLFVHRFGNSTMPLRNLFKNSSYYWGNAILCGYFIYHPHYTPPPQFIIFIGAAMFIVIIFIIIYFLFLFNVLYIPKIGELGNLHAHYILRNLRRPGTKERNIPKGGLFELVSCANYSYEIFAWMGFTFMVFSLAALIFTFQGAFQMYFWAIAKHKRYKKEFNGENGTKLYPKKRKALIPFLI